MENEDRVIFGTMGHEHYKREVIAKSNTLIQHCVDKVKISQQFFIIAKIIPYSIS